MKLTLLYIDLNQFIHCAQRCFEEIYLLNPELCVDPQTARIYNDLKQLNGVQLDVLDQKTTRFKYGHINEIKLQNSLQFTNERCNKARHKSRGK
jgi:hypothetical protein